MIGEIMKSSEFKEEKVKKEVIDGKYISTSRAAELAGVSTQTIRNLCRSGVLSYTLNNGKYMPLKEDVLKHNGSIDEIHKATIDIEQYKKDIYGKQRKLMEEFSSVKDRLQLLSLSPQRIKFIIDLLTDDILSYARARKLDFSDRDRKLINYALFGEYTFRDIVEQEKVSVNAVTFAWRKLLRNVASIKDRISYLEGELGKVSDERDKLMATIIQIESGETIKGTDGKERAMVEHDRYVIDTLNTKVRDLDLTVRSLNCLRAAEIVTVADIVRHKRSDLTRYRNFGKKSLNEIEEFLESKGLAFGMDLSPYAKFLKW